MKTSGNLFGGVLSAFVLFCASAASAVTLSVDKVQQRYPWNGLVDIDYTIQFAPGEDPIDAAKERLVFSLIDESVSPATTNTMFYLNDCAPVPTTAGTYRVTWNANADGVTLVSESAKVRLALRRYAPKYMIVDVSGGTAAESFDVSYMDAPPDGGFNTEEYKGDKIVFRLIPPGSFVMGSPSDQPGRLTNGSETQHNVTLTKPFYIGLFELTQKQYVYIAGAKTFKHAGEYHPADTIGYSAARGSTTWPKSSAVGEASPVGVFRKKTGLAFDFPTNAQWEYACRAGSTGAFCKGTPEATDDTTWNRFASDLGRFSYTKTDGKGGADDKEETADVGSYEPNAWGLYDMHGNVSELVLGWYCTDYASLNQKKDPVGPETGAVVMCGGSYSSAAKSIASSHKESCNTGDQRDWAGFRFALTVE